MLYREWDVRQPEAEKATALAQELDAGRMLCDVLVSRGIDTPEAARELLEGTAELPDPMLLHDMDKAVGRITSAVENEEPMVIFGDYDVDGITATVLLYTYLESMGAEVYYKLPSRSDDDYGLSPAIVNQVADKGISLIITVDNGTSAVEAAETAQQRGVDLVITDHHLPPQTLPRVAALVNPHCEEDSPFAELSGVGVAFMLAAALEGCPAAEMLSTFGDLAAIGTVADVMKLTGLNRTIVKAGLAVLNNTQRPGLTALFEACGWADKEIMAENISFGIAPRLNAAGRMDDATDALRLLLAESDEEAQPILQGILEQNTARQKTEQDIIARISQEIEADPGLQNARLLVVSGEDWHQGVIGIVASRLVDKYAKPAIVISFEKGSDEGRASGRSVRGFSLYNAIASCSDLLLRYGGHDLAAGFSLSRSQLPQLRARLNEWATVHYPVPEPPCITADAEVNLATLNMREVRQLERLAPCGSGNPAPRFVLRSGVLEGIYPVGEGRHCRLRLRQGEASLSAVLFGTGPDALPYRLGDSVDVLLTFSIYSGRSGQEPQVSARVCEMRPAGLSNRHASQSALFESFAAGGQPSNGQRSLLAPTREETAAVYRAVRDSGDVYYGDLRPVFARFGEDLTGRILTACAALEELGLVRKNEHTGRYAAVAVSEKRDLAQSSLLRRLEVQS